MRKIIVLLIILPVIMLASCSAQQTYIDEALNKAFATASPRSEAQTQSDCQRVAEDFTGKPVEFVKKIGADERDEFERHNYPGYYVFKDHLYEYLIDPDYLYIRRINVVSTQAGDELYESSKLKISAEEAEETAKEIFNRAMSKFFLQGSEASATYGKGQNNETILYSFIILEEINGIPTGNGAGLTITDNGAFLGGNFDIGDPNHIKKLLKDKDKMISSDAAAQIAVEKIKAKKELEAENILIDDTKNIEIITWKNMTMWRVYITYDKRGEDSIFHHGAIVHIDAFSGAVGDFSFWN